MLKRSLVIAGLVGLASLVANIATAEEALAPSRSITALSGVDFTDPVQAFTQRETPALLNLGVSGDTAPRFADLTTPPEAPPERFDPRRFEFSLGASGESVGVPLDVAFSQRASFGFNEDGDVARRGRGAELRLGQRLNIRAEDRTPSSEPTWYIFAAQDDEAVTWRPNTRTAFGQTYGGGFGYQEDRVEIGDMQAGVTYERYGVQASLSYIERKVSTRVGRQSFSQDQNFAAVTVTMRR